MSRQENMKKSRDICFEYYLESQKEYVKAIEDRIETEKTDTSLLTNE